MACFAVSGLWNRRRLLGVASAIGLLSVIRSTDADAQTADQAAITCLQDGDTGCAVEVFKTEFSANPFDDDVRENYFVSLLVHGIRSIDKGHLADAVSAVEEAQTLMPSDPRLFYLAEATSRFKKPLYVSRMADRFWRVLNEVSFETRYMKLEGVFGEQIEAYGITYKDHGTFQSFSIPHTNPSTPDQGIAYRFLVYPASTNGDIHLLFGVNPSSGDMCDFSMSLANGGWYVSTFDGQTKAWERVSDGFYAFTEKQWHTLEIWIQGQSMQFFVDRVEVANETLFSYDPGDLFFGVGMPDFPETGTFSAAFTDLSVYELK